MEDLLDGRLIIVSIKHLYISIYVPSLNKVVGEFWPPKPITSHQPPELLNTINLEHLFIKSYGIS